MIKKLLINGKLYFEKKFKDFLNDSRGIGTIEMVLLIVVLLGVLVLFRNYIQTLIVNIFEKIDKQIGNF